MEGFKKAFIRTATRYAEYVEAKIIYAAEIKTTPQELGKTKGGTVYAGQGPTVPEQLCEEMRTLNAVAAAAGKMEGAALGEINLTEAGLKEIMPTPEQEEAMKWFVNQPRENIVT